MSNSGQLWFTRVFVIIALVGVAAKFVLWCGGWLGPSVGGVWKLLLYLLFVIVILYLLWWWWMLSLGRGGWLGAIREGRKSLCSSSGARI